MLFIILFIILFIVLYCSGIPVVIVAVSMAITQTEGYGTDSFCWLSFDNRLALAFIIPVAAVVLVSAFNEQLFTFLNMIVRIVD